MSKYRIEVTYEGRVLQGQMLDDVQRAWGMGYLNRHRECGGPSLGMKLINNEGRIIDEVEENTEVSLGMIAGFPTAAQYRRAAAKAIAKADEIDRQTYGVQHGRIVMVESAPSGKYAQAYVIEDARIPSGYLIKIDGYRTQDHYTAIGPAGRIGPDVPTYAEAMAQAVGHANG